MSEKRTPLPWTAMKTHYGPKIYTAQQGDSVCQFYPFHEKGRRPEDAYMNADANAELIVRSVNALPELVKALEEAKEALQLSYQVCDYPANGKTRQDDAIRTIDAALAKVRP